MSWIWLEFDDDNPSQSELSFYWVGLDWVYPLVTQLFTEEIR